MLRALPPLLAVTLLVAAPASAQPIQIQGGFQGKIVIQNGRVIVGNQEESEKPDEGLGNSRIFVENRSVSNALQAAKREIDNLERLEGQTRLSKMQRAIGALQQILDLDKDFAYYPTDDDRSYIRSAKAEAEQLLLDLPKDGLDMYRTEYGPAARAALDEAIAGSDVAGVEEVGRRYFHTAAGHDATYRLGSFHLDRAEPLAAALVFERIRPTATHLEPTLSLKTAVAWGRAGMPEQSVRTLVEFRQRTRGQTVQIAGEKVRLFEGEDEALPWLVKVLGHQPEFDSLGQEQWTMFRGTPARTGTSRPVSPLWDVRWRYATIERPGDLDEDRLVEIVKVYRELEEKEAQQGLTMPAMHPLVVGDTVVFRTLHNVRALDLATGETAWESVSFDRGFDSLIEADNLNPPVREQVVNGRRIQIQTNNGKSSSRTQKYLSQRAWRNLTAGTLSSDGRFVYSVEDLDFLSTVEMTTRGLIIQNTQQSQKPQTNKLMAFEMKTGGKLTWELGGPRGENEFGLAGSFFLGPPLPLSNRLYAIVERNGELQLAVLEVTETKIEAGTKFEPTVQWTQSLISPEQDIARSPLRRIAGLTPSYGDGVMVCPTASGAVVAVDLARRQLAWGYRYRTSVPSVPGNPFMGRQLHAGALSGNDDEDRWLDAAPTIADGYVVLTPRDSSELHCVDLVTGQRAWDPKPRGDGLYVAGVHNGNVIVVGRLQVQAYRLSDGEPAWTDPIPIAKPSGRGVQSGSLYHLPIRDSGVVTIDLESGRILATSLSATGHVAGNLVSAGGALISLTPERVMAFEPLVGVEADINKRLLNSPNDPVALTRRGALRLHQGREEAALADLRMALENGAGEVTRELFVSTLLEGLRLDFAKYREQAAAALPLIEGTPHERSYLRLHARGLEQIGEREQAFAEYVTLAGLTEGKPSLEPTTSGRLSVRSDRWIRPRLAELFDAAEGDQRDAMQQTLEAELAAARAEEGPDRLRSLVSAFGRLPIAERTRLALVERLDPEKHAAERTLHLQRLQGSRDVETAGFATAELARAALEAGRARDGIRWFDELSKQYADVVCLGDQTGAQLVGEWSSKPAVEEAIASADPWPDRPIEAKTENNKQGVAQTWPVAVYGSPGPFYDDWTFTLDNPRQNLTAVDPQGREVWKLSIRDGSRPVANPYGNFIRTQGHLVVACFSTYFVVIDPLHSSGKPKVVWSRGLQEAGDNIANVRQIAGPGVFKLMMVDRYGRPLGSVGAVRNDVVYYQIGTKLYAADLLSGDVLWERRNVGRGCVVRADDDVVLVIENDDVKASILHADDGHEIGTRPIAKENERVMIEGRRVLSWTSTATGRDLALRDIVAGADVWKVSVDGRSKVSLIDGEDVALFEGNGRFRILRIADAKPLVDAKLEAPKALAGITVTRSADQYILLPNDPSRKANNVVRVAGIGFNNPIVHGDVIAFDRESGRERWRTRVENQSFPSGQPRGLPVLILTSRNFRIQRQPGRVNTNQYALMLLDTRSGKVVLDKTEQRSAFPFALDSKPEKGTLGLSFYQRKVQLTFAKSKPKKGDEPQDDGTNTES